MSETGTYGDEFFKELHSGSYSSAQQIVPFLMGLFGPRRIVDVGCGAGAWLSAFMEHGADYVIGVDGAYVNRDLLAIPKTSFIAHDLTKPFTTDEKFDLAVSLEVGEHLPASSAQPYVDSLVNLAPIVLFSAAIPGQSGVAHINEQWPHYWADLFSKSGYVVVDALRPRYWHDESIEPWYRQNALFFVDNRETAILTQLEASSGNVAGVCPSLVHPWLYQRYRDAPKDELRPLRYYLSHIPAAVRRSVRWRFIERRMTPIKSAVPEHEKRS
jgi:SAM-dependent methyltransferase